MKIIRLFNIPIGILILGSILLVNLTAQTTYYVDAISGNNSNNGTSTSTAWKTLSKLSSSTFSPGSIIKFKAGQTFTGTLVITSSGTPANPILYEMYGTGALPILDGLGSHYTVYSINKEYLEFKNIQFTNHRSGTIMSTDRFNALLFKSDDFGTVNHLHFDNITVFDVNSSIDESVSDTRYYGGILFYAKGDSLKSNFNDILIENSTFHNIGRTGVNFRSDWWYRNSDTNFGDDLGNGTLDNWYASTNVIIKNNTFDHIRGNGLIIRVTIDAMIEGNLFDYCGDGISGNATFCFNTDGTVFQFNEARNTVYNLGDTDARGIDSDYRTKNTLVQYNYLHNNGKGGFVATGGPQSPGFVPERFNKGTVVRYNILENNDLQGMHFSGNIDGLEVYNNVLYADSTYSDIVILNFKKWTAWPNDINFKNNIFFFAGSNSGFIYNDGQSSSNGATNLSFSNNIFFGPTPANIPISGNTQSMPNITKDNNYSLFDPLFVDPGNGTDGFHIIEGSPAAGTGLNFFQPLLDYYGNTIDTSSVNIGTYQGVLAELDTKGTENNQLPFSYALHQNYPNPFNPATIIHYDLPEKSYVNIIIYDMLGRQVKTLINQIQTAGYKSVIWDATNDNGTLVSAGVYLYQNRAGDFVQTRKMVLLK